MSDTLCYNTRFLGFGWNKASDIVAHIVVLPDVFIIRQPHTLPYLGFMALKVILLISICISVRVGQEEISFSKMHYY